MKIPDINEMKSVTKESYAKRSRLELKKAVEKVTEVIKSRAEGGYGFVDASDSEIHQVITTSPFVNWSMIARVYREAGYKLIGESNAIVWASEDELK